MNKEYIEGYHEVMENALSLARRSMEVGDDNTAVIALLGGILAQVTAIAITNTGIFEFLSVSPDAADTE